MEFNTKRSIADQLLDSILTYPHEWRMKPKNGVPTWHIHNSGLALEVRANYSVRIVKPAIMRQIDFDSEEDVRLWNAINQIWTERAEERFVQLMDRPEVPPFKVVESETPVKARRFPEPTLINVIVFCLVSLFLIYGLLSL